MSSSTIAVFFLPSTDESTSDIAPTGHTLIHLLQPVQSSEVISHI